MQNVIINKQFKNGEGVWLDSALTGDSTKMTGVKKRFLCIALVALVSVTLFLVTDVSIEKTYSFSNQLCAMHPGILTLCGKDAALFEAEIFKPRDSANIQLRTGMRIYSVKSGFSYSFERDHSFSTEIMAKRLSDGAWKDYCEVTLGNVDVSQDMFAHRHIISHRTDTLCEDLYLTLPLWEPGRYRIDMRLYEYDKANRCTTDVARDIYFEYVVPEISNDLLEPLQIDFYESFLPNGESSGYAYLGLALRANAKAQYVQPSSIKFEKRVLWGYVPVYMELDSAAQEGLDYILARYMERTGDQSYRYGEVYCISLDTLMIKGWQEGHKYRLSATFTENPDGSGEQYTLTLQLRFDE